ncbi:MAG: phosphodiester glycosidase family protein [Bacillaceae bacterium]|nr:phosphodiester glycosidase family protein [Bacillaceae bacterium]
MELQGKLITIFLLFASLVLNPSLLAAQSAESFTVSPGIEYEKRAITYEKLPEELHILSVDLNNPFARIEMFVPDPLTELMTTTQQTRVNHKEGHRIVGAVNAAFFSFDNNLPLYLLIRDNILVNAGVISDSNDYYVNQPYAFGIDLEGKAKIAPFELDLSFTHNSKEYPIRSIDRARLDNDIYLYTPNYYKDVVDTNEYGIEFVIQNSGDTPFEQLEIGEKLAGEVVKIRRYGDKEQVEIPENGFVLSASGGQNVNLLGHIQEGDPIEISIDMDEQWKNGQFLLASGPLLVQDGKADLSMDPTSRRAQEVTSRTAVAVDRDKNQVFFVAVDGKQADSEGMNLLQFADYLAQLGVDEALNLDGGGSTTMAVRFPGNVFANLANDPSGGRERKVSATLQAISLAPNGDPTTLLMKPFIDQPILKGARVSVEPDYLLDQYYNPLPILKDRLTFDVSNQLGYIKDRTFYAENSGVGTISAIYGPAKNEKDIRVVSKPDRLELTPPDEVIQQGERVSFNLRAYTYNGEEIYFNRDQIEWKATDELQMVRDGLFEAVSEKGIAKVTAVLEGEEVTADLWVGISHFTVNNMDDLEDWKIFTIKADAQLDGSAGLEPKAEGDGSIQLTYDFRDYTYGTSAVYMKPPEPITLKGTPDYLGMWVFGDANQHWLRGKVMDGKGKLHTVNFTEYNGLDWHGWRFVKAYLPDDLDGPIKLVNIYMAEPDEKDKNTGSLFLDDLVAVYTNDYVPDVPDTADVKAAKSNKVWHIRFNTPMKASTINSETIYVVNNRGEKVKTDVTLVNERVAEVRPESPYRLHEFYKLIVTDQVESVYNETMKQPEDLVFQIVD